MKTLFTIVIFLVTINSFGQCNQGVNLFAGAGSSYSNVIKGEYIPSLNTIFSAGYIINKNLMVRLDYQFVRFKNDNRVNTVFEEVGDIGKLSTNIFKIGLFVGDFKVKKSIHYYVSGGFGIYNVSVDKKVNSIEATSSQSKFGLAFGLGTSIKVCDRLRFFLEGQGNAMFGNGTFTHFFPLLAGFNYNFSN